MEQQFDPKIIELILFNGVGGLSVRALTAQLKKRLRAKGFYAYFVSLLACAAATAVYLLFAGWNWLAFASYTGIVFAVANGFYRVSKKKI